MLSILNTLCHGYVAVPVIQACRRRLLRHWSVDTCFELSAVAQKSGANPGYLRIALSTLEALGWVSSDGDNYKLRRQINFDIVPDDILDLYQISPEEIFTHTSIQPKLTRWLAGLKETESSTAVLRLVEGAVLLPILIALRKLPGPQLALPSHVDSRLKTELGGLFVDKGWAHKEGSEFSLSDVSKELIHRAYVMGIAASYRPMLARMEELLFGNSAAVFARGTTGESHIDRQMNVIASGLQHQRYFKDAEHHVLSIFNDVPLTEQPRYIADIGCGDGTLLKHLYEAISTKTGRGRNLSQYPLQVIGIDYNQAALIETEKTLKDIPHLTLSGDISNPQQIVRDLRSHGIDDPENTLYLRSFLDHNFLYKKVATTDPQLADDFPLPPGSHYVDAQGQPLDGKHLLNAWHAHLERWSTIANRHGLIILESHCLPASVSGTYFDRTESFYFDAVHALSGQYLVKAEVFIVLAARVGLFPKEPPLRYPKTLPFCRITLSHFEKRDYVVRHAQLSDLDALMEMEAQCWPAELRTSGEDIERRLQSYPRGQFVLELEGRAVGVIYSQRIENEEVLKTASVDSVARLHSDNGPVVQLIALNVLPSLQGRKLGDELLSFMLQRCSVMNGVEKLVGVTVCKDHVRKQGGARFIDYLRARDEHGVLLDPNLRFHELHGATIGEVIEGYRPRDVKNEGRGVLIHYDLFNLKRRAVSGSASSVDLRGFVEASILRCLREKSEGFAPDRPLMEMGLDSADLLELSELLSRQFNIPLEPAFFFEHKTCNRIVSYLASRTTVTLKADVATGDLQTQAPHHSHLDQDVAIIGIATRLPGGISTIGDFWTLLKEGRSAIGSLPAGRWQWPADIDHSGEHKGIDRGGFLDRLDTFDAAFFRISPREAELMDPQQRILMELAWQTIEDAAYTQESLANTKTGVFIGASGSDYLRLLDESAIPVDAHVGTGNSMAILANRLSYFFDFHGPSLQIDTACSSSLVALHYAMQSLRTGESSQALVGGINVMCHPANTIAYYKSGMLSHDGACKTFDSRADGYVRSEGAVMILIKPLKAAEADGDDIYAVIKGTAINHGGLASGLTVPNPEKQARLLQAAWEAAGVPSSTITYIEMHGTGTPLGDPIEVEGIRRAFATTGFNNGGSCALSSVKTNLGHLEAAAGLTGLLKVVLCLRHRELPATVHLREINRHVHLDDNILHVLREHQTWSKSTLSDRRRAGVSSFGFGGANAHAVLEEYCPADSEKDDSGPHLFVLSAKTDERLAAYAARYVEWLSSHEIPIADLAYTLQIGRQSMESRLAIAATDKTDLIGKLKRFCARPQSSAEPQTNRETKIGTAVAAERGRQRRRVHLPTYPFALKSYWFKPLPPVNVVVHPLVQRIIPDSSNSHFTSTFDGREFFLRDHEVSGHKTLPGVTHLEMVRKAFEIATGTTLDGNSSLRFTSLIWSQLFQITADAKTLHIEIRGNDDGTVRYEVYSGSKQKSEPNAIHGQGSVEARGLDSRPSLDLVSLQEQMSLRRLGSTEFYEHYRHRGINYGPAHRGVLEMSVGVDQALARIALPLSEEGTAGQYLLHPSMLDAALQTGIALQMIGNASSLSTDAAILPFFAHSIEVFSPTTAVMWAWARESRGAPGSLDIDLCDESGRVCLRLKGFRTRRAIGNRPAPTTLKPVWTPFHPATSDRSSLDKQTRVVIVGAAKSTQPALRKLLPNSTFVEADADDFADCRDIDHVVWFFHADLAAAVSDDALIHRQREGVLRLLDLIKALLHAGSSSRETLWTVCTIQTQAVDANDRVDPTHASIHGLVGSMAKEFPKWRVRLIDLESDWLESINAVFDLPFDDSGNPVAYRRREWFRREFIPVGELRGQERLLKENGTYVVIGGAGGIGKEWSRWLIERYRAQMIWIGRRETDASIQQHIDELASYGPVPYYISADATNLQSLQEAYSEIKRRFPKIDGVVHSAIVLKDGSLANMTREQFIASLEANVDVCVRMAQVFNSEPLDFVLFFSSIQSFCTFGGQSNYAAGCTFKDAFAERLRQDWPCAVKVVNWGYWGSVGVVASDYYREAMAEKGFGSVEPEEGFAGLQKLLDGPMDQVSICKTLRKDVIVGIREDESLTSNVRTSARFNAKPEKWLPQVPKLSAALDDGGFSLPGLTAILAKVLWANIQALGFSGRDQAPVGAIRHGIDRERRCARWVDGSLAILEKENYLHVDGDSCFATDPTILRIDEVWREWNSYKEPYLANADTRAQIVLLDECLRNLPEILTGKILATDVMFPGSSTDLAAGVYRNNRIADFFNNALATTVKAYLEECIRIDGSARFRILEIGAGTGGTTSALLSVLAPLQDHVLEYCFTDVSSAFLDSAHQQFGGNWRALTTRRFDIEKPLAEQSIPVGEYDVVIAANALHATRDMRNTLRNAKAALRRDGLLVLNEVSANSLFLHLTFGLLKGWWLFEDPELRIPGCPALSANGWRSVLENEGFESIVFPTAHAHDFGQQIIVAQSDGLVRQRRGVSPAPVPQGAKLQLASQVADRFTEDRVKAIVRESIARNLKMDEAEIQDGRVFSDYGVDSIIGVRLVNQINQACGTALPVPALFDYNNVNQLSAFVTKQIEAKAPQFRTASVGAGKSRAPDRGSVTLSHGTSERGIVISRPGSVSEIEITESDSRPLTGHEVRVAVRACSLNFADLLCIKGLYPNMPGYPFTPGLEASGVVVQVGSAVRSVAVGAPVVVFLGKSLGAHATVITCSEDCVLKKPEFLSFEEACTLPAVGITMVVAFRKAQLRKGESILIQTAAGGTGLVAVQLAQHYGAEIYATAGSEEKLDYLRKLGVLHTINYRETDFAAEIKQLTKDRGVDVVINTLSGPAMQQGLNCLASGGRYIEVAMTALKAAKAIDLSVLSSNQAIFGVDLVRLASEDGQRFVSCYEELVELVSKGVVRPTVSEVLPFDRIKEAYARLEERKNIGKIVVSVAASHELGERLVSNPLPALRPDLSRRERSGGVAVVGMSGRFAKSDSLAELWKHLANGDDLIDKVQRWDLRQDAENACFDGGLLEDIDKFDAAFFDISALEAIYMDPQQRLFLEEAWKALEDAGYAGTAIEGTSCGVYVGCTSGDYSRLIGKHSPAHSFWGNAGSVIPARIAYYLNLRGPAIAIDTACSSSLVAIHSACESLRSQEIDLALAGGVFILSTPDFYLSASRAGMLSPNGRCYTFDARADGFVPGEGVGVLVLKRLDDAIKDGDHIYGVIPGSGLNQDGKTNGLTAPSANSQKRLERQVYETFSIHPEQIQMLEAHGTGTKLGDPIEFDALTQAFRQDTQQKEFCAIGSIKSNLGHTATAAGVAGVLKILLSLQHKQIPPTLHFRSGNPAIGFSDSPFYVNTELKDWVVPDGSVRCGAVSSFGFSGTNAHMVIEEPPALERNHRQKPAYVIVLSGRTAEQLQRQVEQLTDFCAQHPAIDLGNLSFTLLVGRRHLSHRLATLVGDAQELIEYLREWLDTRHVLQVQVSEVLEDSRREDRSLKEFGNECIRVCSGTTDTDVYLTKLAGVATLFMQGYALEFAQLFAHDGYSRIPLPTYPFSRERYWVDAEPADTKSTAARLHPLVHQNQSTLAAQLYRSEFTGQEFFLADHRLDGKSVMPAVAHLEMAIAAGSHALSDSGMPIQLKNVVWPTPFTVGAKAEPVLIRLQPKAVTTIDFEIASETHQVYCQGTLERNPESGSTIDLRNITKVDATSKLLSARECYDVFQELGFIYGPSHRALESVLVSGQRAVARLSLPEIPTSTAEGYFLHPSIMDAALQATIVLQTDANASTRIRLPYAVEQVTVHAPTERQMWAIVHSTNSGGLDIDVCNEQGTICVSLKGLTLRHIEGRPQARTATEACLFFQPILEPKVAVPESSSEEYWQRCVVLCNADPLAADVLRRGGINVDIVPSDVTDSIEQQFETCVAKIVEVAKSLSAVPARGKTLLQILINLQALSGLSAIVKTIRQENPTIVAQLIELEPADTPRSIAGKVEENGNCPADTIMVYRNNVRHTAVWHPTSLTKTHRQMPWREKGIYLITGGAGGLGQIFAREIVDRAPGSTLVLAGRSDLSGSRLAEIESLKASGVTVYYRQADISRKTSVDALLSWIREEIGELSGVLHCAGVMRDGLFVRKRTQDIKEVLAPKVPGVVNLDLATQDIPLDFFVCFSSVAGAIGNIGQIDYGAANAFMDSFARYRAGLVASGKRHGHTLSINWPLWHGGLKVESETADHLSRTFGMTPMSSSVGIDAFYQCYADGSSQLMVLNGDPNRIGKCVEPPPSPSGRGRREAAGEGSKSTRETTIAYLRQVIATVLQLPLQRVKDTDSFERYGIDSILALKLTNELEKTFGSLPKILFFEHPNLRSLADYLIQNYRPQLPSAIGPEPDAIPKSAPAPTPTVLPTKAASPVPQSSALDIAIIGLSGRYPGARAIDDFWENLKIGRDCISEIPAERWNYHRYFNPDKKPGTIYSKWGGFIDGVDEFDPLFFNISPREAELMDPQERLFLQCAYETIEDAGYVPESIAGKNDPGTPGNVGVFVGVMYEEYQLFGVEETINGRPIALSGNPSSIANRVSYFCNFSGPCMVVDTMCSSSLTAIHLACQSLRLGECTAAIAGGVNISIHPNKYLLLSQGRFASSAGRCESFGKGGDGYVPGEGVGAVLLKPLSMALHDGDHIYGVIKGTAVNHGGKTNGFTVPNPNAQGAMIAQAIKQAGVHPRDISYVEAHGTGTSLGDPIEIAGLTQAFRDDSADGQYCAIGSVKSNIGHCESAAGIVGVTKVLLQLKHKQLVPSLHSRTLNPLIEFKQTQFRVQQELSSWGEKAPRIAGISSFGAGGSNAHVIIQESEDGETESTTSRDVLIVLSAKNNERLTRVAFNLLEHLKRTNSPRNLTNLAYTLQVGRVAMEERLAFIVKSQRELEEKLQRFLEQAVNSGEVFRGNIHSVANATMFLNGGNHELDHLGQAWVNGADVGWSALYRLRPRRVSLPTYPFARERYWVPAQATTSSVVVEDLEKVVLTKEWRPHELGALETESEGFVLVLGTRLTKPLVTKLFADRPQIKVVEILPTDFDSSEAAESLYRGLQSRISNEGFLGLIDCAALDVGYGEWSFQEFGKIRFIQLLLSVQAVRGFKLIQLVLNLYPFRSHTTTLQGARLAGLYRMINAEYRKVRSGVVDVDLGLSHNIELAAVIQRESES